MSDTNEDPNEETIKCVVVGDNNAGKTRLICSRVYKESAPNYRCISNVCHIPTVWAIDQYRMNHEVLANARCKINGVDVSLRLWDTFGDHHKNRKYALGKADVVIICFSVTDRNSLAHVRAFWEPEVRRHCRNVPIILVACKIDLRFVDLVKANRAKGILCRPVKCDDLLYPEDCSLVAKSLNCLYYETSVFLGYGVDQVFENACRMALFHRRSVSVWTSSALKKVRRPTVQKPLEPPKPDPVPLVEYKKTTPPLHNLPALYQQSALTDVTFVCQGRAMPAHRSILAVASDFFVDVFALDGDRELALTSDDFEEEVMMICKRVDASTAGGECSYRVEGIDARLFGALLRRCYACELTRCYDDGDVRQLGSLMRRLDMAGCDGDEEGESAGERRESRLMRQAVRDRMYADVRFVVDDGVVRAHKLLLSAGSDVMYAMFTGNFIERTNDEVKMPDTTRASMDALISFVYTDRLPIIVDHNLNLVGDLLRLANRLCLPRLIFLVECQMIERFEEQEESMGKKKDDWVEQLLEDVMCALVLSRTHNACNLTKWCLRFLCVHYNQACWTVPKLVKALPTSVQHFIEEHRWPPVWYIKQKDVYDRALYLQKKADCARQQHGVMRKSKK